jgi:hypothetical protein
MDVFLVMTEFNPSEWVNIDYRWCWLKQEPSEHVVITQNNRKWSWGYRRDAGNENSFTQISLFAHMTWQDAARAFLKWYDEIAKHEANNG